MTYDPVTVNRWYLKLFLLVSGGKTVLFSLRHLRLENINLSKLAANSFCLNWTDILWGKRDSRYFKHRDNIVNFYQFWQSFYKLLHLRPTQNMKLKENDDEQRWASFKQTFIGSCLTADDITADQTETGRDWGGGERHHFLLASKIWSYLL